MSASAAPDPLVVDEGAHEEQHVFVGTGAMLCVLVLSVALWLANQIKKAQIYWLSDSGAAMLLGVFIGAIVNLFGWNTSHTHLLMFEPELFFFVLLPPIIFEAGLSMQKAAFFRNVGSILLFAVLGTLVSTLVVGYGLYGLAKIGVVGLDSDSPVECLLFGSLLSAVDPVAVLSILQQSKLKSPLLLSLIFGESVLNDAISIVLFNTFKTYHASTAAGMAHRASIKGGAAAIAAAGEAADALDHFTVASLFFNFLVISLGSLCMGVLVGLACSLLFRRSQLHHTPDVEFTLIIFTAYAAYCSSEIMGLSGIMALFFCSIIIAHYNWFNMSPTSRRTTKHSFKSFALISETFLFTYLGISAVVSVRSVLHLEWSFMLIVCTLVLCIFARAVHIFPLSFLSNLCTRSSRSSSSSSTSSSSSSASSSGRISFPMQCFLFFSSIRGAIAFALSLNVFTAHRAVIISTTMVVVILTTLVLGGMTSPMLRRLKLVEEETRTNVGDGRTELELELDHSGVVDGSEGFHEAVSPDGAADGRAGAERRGAGAAHNSLEMDDMRAMHAPPDIPSAIPLHEHEERARFSDRRDSSSSPAGGHHHSNGARHSHEEPDEDLGWVSRQWHHFDEAYMQRVFGGAAHQRRFASSPVSGGHQQRRDLARSDMPSSGRGRAAGPSRVLAHPSEMQPMRHARSDSATEEEAEPSSDTVDEQGMGAGAGFGRVVSAPPLRSPLTAPSLSFHSFPPETVAARSSLGNGAARADSSTRKARHAASRLQVAELALSPQDLEAPIACMGASSSHAHATNQSRFAFATPAPSPFSSPPPRIPMPLAP